MTERFDPAAATRVVLLRHGETDHNAGLRMQGQLDVPLNERGRAQAARVAAPLAERSPTLLLSSDLARASCTAAALAEHSGLAVRHDTRLRETHLGQWQGLTHAEVEEHTPGGLARWRVDATYVPPGGETRVQVAARGMQVLEETDEAAGTVVLVAHGGLIAAVTAQALGMPVARWSAFGGLGNGRWVELRRRQVDGAPGWRLQAWNAGAGD